MSSVLVTQKAIEVAETSVKIRKAATEKKNTKKSVQFEFVDREMN